MRKGSDRCRDAYPVRSTTKSSATAAGGRATAKHVGGPPIPMEYLNFANMFIIYTQPFQGDEEKVISLQDYLCIFSHLNMSFILPNFLPKSFC